MKKKYKSIAIKQNYYNQLDDLKSFFEWVLVNPTISFTLFTQYIFKYAWLIQSYKEILKKYHCNFWKDAKHLITKEEFEILQQRIKNENT